MKANSPVTEHIIVPLRLFDSVEEVIPYLEFVAQPRMEVIFLMRSGENRFPWWSDEISAFNAGANRMSISNLAATIAQQRQSRSAEERISTARRILHAKGVTTHLEFCSTSLKRAVRAYHGRDTKTVVLLCRKFFYLRQLASTLRRCLRPFGKEDAAAVLFLRSEGRF